MLSPPFSPIQRHFDFARRTARAAAGWVLRDEVVMGTAIHVELWADDARAGASAAAAVMDEMHRIDRAMSPHKPHSELCRINRDAARQAVPLSDEMFGLVDRALGFSRLTGGAFDISYAAAGQLYDYREKLRPSAEQLAQACELVGWQQLHLDPRARTLRFAREGMRIDLGGFAKGHAVDTAITLLRRRGVKHAYVSAGGDSRVLGDRRGRPWTVAIRDPRRAGQAVAVLPLGIAVGFLMIGLNFLTNLWAAVPFLIVMGAVCGYLVVPMNALLQHRGHNLMGAGRSIAVQNFNEQACILALGALYVGMVRLGLSAFTAITVLGTGVAIVMWLIRRWHQRNCIDHHDEVERLLAIARTDKH